MESVITFQMGSTWDIVIQCISIAIILIVVCFIVWLLRMMMKFFSK